MSEGIIMRYYIDLLKLERHIEGGYFCQIYQSSDRVKPISSRYTNEKTTVERSAGTSIYFLLNEKDFSAWHSLKSDEIWHYYDGGSPLAIHIIDENGKLRTHLLGNPRLTHGACFQVIIKAGCWFAAEVVDKKSFGLVGCTVSPGFEYQDFFLADSKDLAAQFPQHAEIISKFIHHQHK
jgi:predicted cupin superfamily sugar epimerase